MKLSCAKQDLRLSDQRTSCNLHNVYKRDNTKGKKISTFSGGDQGIIQKEPQIMRCGFEFFLFDDTGHTHNDTSRVDVVLDLGNLKYNYILVVLDRLILNFIFECS